MLTLYFFFFSLSTFTIQNQVLVNVPPNWEKLEWSPWWPLTCVSVASFQRQANGSTAKLNIGEMSRQILFLYLIGCLFFSLRQNRRLCKREIAAWWDGVWHPFFQDKCQFKRLCQLCLRAMHLSASNCFPFLFNFFSNIFQIKKLSNFPGVWRLV